MNTKSSTPMSTTYAAWKSARDRMHVEYQKVIRGEPVPQFDEAIAEQRRTLKAFAEAGKSIFRRGRKIA
jgi:hypothetical protein